MDEGEALPSSHCLGITCLVAPLLPGITLLWLDDMSAVEFADTGQLCFCGPSLMGQLIISCACLLNQLGQDCSGDSQTEGLYAPLWLIIL